MGIFSTQGGGRTRVRSLARWAAVLAATSTLLATGLTVVADSAASAASANSLTGASRSSMATQVAQSTLKLTSTYGTVGSSLTLTTSGGSGSGAVTYVLNSSGSANCLISSSKLEATKPGTCTVTATKAADSTYLAASSAPTTVTFVAAPLKAQASLKLTSTYGTVGAALLLTSSGGSGTGAVTYVINSSGTAGCLISYGKLDATTAGTCTVTATKAADSTYLSANSPQTKVTFVPTPLKTQAALAVTSTSGTVGTALILTSSGGSGTGALTYVVSNSGSAGCWITTNSELHATRGGACIVTVTKAADSVYAAAVSPVAKVSFNKVVVATHLSCRGEFGLVRVGQTVIVTILGAHFYGKPTIVSNQSGTSAVVIHDHGNELLVRVGLRSGSPQGKYEFTTTLANGNSCRVQYLVR